MRNFLLIFAAFLFPFSASAQALLPDTSFINHNNDWPGAEWQYSFVHITDVHIGEGTTDYGTPGFFDAEDAAATDEGNPARRWRNAVRWINENAELYKIKFVVVSGDLTDSGETSEFLKFKEIGDSLTIPYIPLVGNHDVWPYVQGSQSAKADGDSLFNMLFEYHFDELKTTFTGWDDGTRLTRVLNTDVGDTSYLQNFAFEYGSYLFLLADFGTRQPAPFVEPGVGPPADLMNFPGGSFPWFKDKISTYQKKGRNNMMIFTHFPPTKDPWALVNAFSTQELGQITDFLLPYKNNLGKWFAGHIHRSKIYGVTTGTFSGETVMTCVETAANKEYPNGLFRIVKMWDTLDVTSAPEVTIPQNNQPEITVFPNPSSGSFIVSLHNLNGEEIELNLVDVQGRVLLHRNYSSCNFSITEKFEIEDVPAGLYWVQVKSNSLNINRKIVHLPN